MRALAALSCLLLSLLALSCGEDATIAPGTEAQTTTVVPGLASDGNKTPEAEAPSRARPVK